MLSLIKQLCAHKPELHLQSITEDIHHSLKMIWITVKGKNMSAHSDHAVNVSGTLSWTLVNLWGKKIIITRRWDHMLVTRIELEVRFLWEKKVPCTVIKAQVFLYIHYIHCKMIDNNWHLFCQLFHSETFYSVEGNTYTVIFYPPDDAKQVDFSHHVNQEKKSNTGHI